MNKRSESTGIQNPRFRIHNLFLYVLCAFAVIIFGCQTDRVTTSDQRPMPPDPHPAPRPPASAVANRMAFFVGQKPNDTNGNGFPDLISVTVMLVSSPHPTPIRQEGAFVFTMHEAGMAGRADVKPLAEWRIEGDAVLAAMSTALAGPCYQFQLSLLTTGGDVMPLDRADLLCRFEPANGSAPVRSDGVRTIQIGRRLATKF